MEEQQRIPRPPTRNQSTLPGSPTPRSARQLARSKGLARVSAITLGAGAASALGALAIAVTLPGPTAATTATTTAGKASTTTASKAATPQTAASDDDSSEEAAPKAAPQAAAPKAAPQAAKAPTTTNNPPVATSGGS